MGWQVGEVWLDGDVGWFRERRGARAASAIPAVAALAAFAPPGIAATTFVPGLAASRARRAARRRREHTTRSVSATAFAIGSAALLPWAAAPGGKLANPLAEDPPSLTFRSGANGVSDGGGSGDHGSERFADDTAAGDRASSAHSAGSRVTRTPEVDWNRASAHGVWFGGSLHGATQLPTEGPDWITWNPVTDRVPNRPGRLYGHERTVRTIIAVAKAYRAAHPNAARIVVGDVSFRDGGVMDQHASHQNGLDVDVYYPRRDRRVREPRLVSEIDRGLAQDLLDRFVAAGAKVIFVGYHTGLTGPSDIVVPYPNHENHMHVRFPRP